MNIFDHYSHRYERTREEELSLQEYLELCKRDRLAYATAAERMLQGTPATTRACRASSRTRS